MGLFGGIGDVVKGAVGAAEKAIDPTGFSDALDSAKKVLEQLATPMLKDSLDDAQSDD